MWTIKDKYERIAKSSSAYVKPYTKRIDNLKMPSGNQHPKMHQFDDKGNPKQLVAYFLETCNNAGTNGDFLVKQFVLSLKRKEFDWYNNLAPGSIWLVLTYIYGSITRFRFVSMLELSHTKEWKGEPVIACINRWRSLCLDFKDKLCKISLIEMCNHCMNWGLQYILKGIQPRTYWLLDHMTWS